MTASHEIESTLTDRYQTTVPETIRRTLKLGKRDKIHYIIRNGEVMLKRAEVSEGDDPVLGRFLEFLARDIGDHPERIQAVDRSLVKRIQSLVVGVKVDLEESLSADDE